MLSLVIAGLINLVNWRWSFYYIGICSLPLAIAALWIIPAPPPKTKTRANLDVVGLTTMSCEQPVGADESGGTDTSATQLRWSCSALA